MNILYKSIFGSRLYGTHLPDSDTDHKIVYLPSKRDLFLGKPLKNSVYQTNTQGKNTKVDEDVEHIPLHKLVVDFVKGQTYAIELVFSPGIDELYNDDDLRTRVCQSTNSPSEGSFFIFACLCMDLRTKCLTRDVTALVGYLKGQAKRYSSKGDKVNALEEVLETLSKIYYTENGDVAWSLSPKLSEFKDKLPTNNKYLSLETDADSNEYYNVCGSLHQMSVKIDEVLERVRTQYNRYGNRAQLAASLDGQDFKAIMHSVRVGMEAEELLTTGKLSFPFTGVRLDYLMRIRKGEVSLDETSEWTENTLQRIRNLEEQSTLPTQKQVMPIAEDLLYDFVLNHAA